MPMRAQRFSGIVLALIGAPLLIIMALGLWNMQSHYRQFLSRSSEVDELIRGAYLYHYKNASWPENVAALEQASGAKLPAEWTYVFIDTDDLTKRPVLWVHGPLHMTLKYEFRDGGVFSARGGWTAKMEGDQLAVTIPERIPDRPAVQP
jgi:hypothetical protein